MTNSNQDSEQPLAISDANAVPVQNPTHQPASSFGKNVWRLVKFLFNVGLIIIFVCAIAAGYYFGWPYVYNQYVLPVQNNTAQIARLEKTQEQSSQQIAGLEAQMAVILTEQAQQASAMEALGSQIEALQTESVAQTSSLAALEKLQKALDENQTALQTDQKELNSELERQVKLLHAMELLSRARLFLYQSNYGLAKQDIQTAREILASAQASAPHAETGTAFAPPEQIKNELAEIVQRLDLCLSRLPEFPVAASDDLDIAWQILLTVSPGYSSEQGIPQPLSATETPTSAVTQVATKTPTLDVSLTPTQTSTSTATPTP